VATKEEEVVAAKARWKAKGTAKRTASLKVREEVTDLVRVSLVATENSTVTALQLGKT
jgi:hypothetical protein